MDHKTKRQWIKDTHKNLRYISNYLNYVLSEMIAPKKHLNFNALRSVLSKQFERIEDKRQQSKVNHSLHDSLMSGFACMYFQDPSLLAFQQRLQDSYQNNNLKSLFAVESIPKETQMREMIDSVATGSFEPIFNDYFLKLQRSKILSDYAIIPKEHLYYMPIDATQYYQSTNISCSKCLKKTSSKDETTYSHQALQPSILHPALSQVIPLMPEEIHNCDGESKQDCEINAAKRLIPKIRKAHPKLNILLGGDGLYSKQPMIELVKQQAMHFLFVAKPDDHVYMMEWLTGYQSLNSYMQTDNKGRQHVYEWMNDVPLNGRPDSIRVNYLKYKIISTTVDGTEKIHYKNSWVTDIVITDANCVQLTDAGRSRWKLENEYFNTLKNQGYCLEHSYGHGKQNLCFNFYVLTLLAFFFHQIFELTDKAYQACRVKTGSKREMWNTLRSYIRLYVFESWQQLLDFLLTPSKYITGQLMAPS
jgi:hypothetical protein